MRKTVAALGLVALSAALMIAFSMGRSTAAGGPKSYFAVLNTGQQEVLVGENEPVGAGMGVAHVLLQPDRTVCVNMTVTGWSGTISAAHIHGPGKAGVRAPQIIPLNAEADGVWKQCQPDIPLTSAQVDMLNTGKMYLNVHTTPDFGPGELRGQLYK